MGAPSGNYLLSPSDSDVIEHIKLFIKFKEKTFGNGRSLYGEETGSTIQL
jgi:hypothetical protein